MLRLLLVTTLLAAGCGSDDPADCLPQGRVVIGAIGTAGDPLPSYASCFASSNPALSLGSARGAQISGTEITFDDSGLTAEVDADACRVSIRYQFASQLTDGTPTAGVSQFAADLTPGGTTTWSANAEGSSTQEWTNEMSFTEACGNQIDGVVIEIQAN